MSDKKTEELFDYYADKAFQMLLKETLTAQKGEKTIIIDSVKLAETSHHLALCMVQEKLKVLKGQKL